MNRYAKDIEKVTDTADILGFNNAEFCEGMKHQDRTSQQNFTRLCLTWLMTCSSDDYGHDERNKASHDLGVAIKNRVTPSEMFLPFI